MSQELVYFESRETIRKYMHTIFVSRGAPLDLVFASGVFHPWTGFQREALNWLPEGMIDWLPEGSAELTSRRNVGNKERVTTDGERPRTLGKWTDFAIKKVLVRTVNVNYQPKRNTNQELLSEIVRLLTSESVYLINSCVYFTTDLSWREEHVFNICSYWINM